MVTNKETIITTKVVTVKVKGAITITPETKDKVVAIVKAITKEVIVKVVAIVTKGIETIIISLVTEKIAETRGKETMNLKKLRSLQSKYVIV
jgi:hypothetical protein